MVAPLEGIGRGAVELEALAGAVASGSDRPASGRMEKWSTVVVPEPAAQYHLRSEIDRPGVETAASAMTRCDPTHTSMRSWASVLMLPSGAA